MGPAKNSKCHCMTSNTRNFQIIIWATTSLSHWDNNHWDKNPSTLQLESQKNTIIPVNNCFYPWYIRIYTYFSMFSQIQVGSLFRGNSMAWYSAIFMALHFERWGSDNSLVVKCLAFKKMLNMRQNCIKIGHLLQWRWPSQYSTVQCWWTIYCWKTFLV